MERESFTIVNENEHDVIGTIERMKKQGRYPCIIFSPGLLDTRKSPYIALLAKKFLEANFVVVLFDYSQGFGESGGRSEDVTISQRSRDLERVVAYAKRRSFVDDRKIVVFGHSYGAMTALAMEGFNHILAGLILVSTPARVEETRLTRMSDHEFQRVKLKRYFHIPVDEGKEVRINFTFLEDGMKIDMDRAARNLNTPTLFIHGEKDESVLVANTQRMFERAIGPKELALLPFAHDLKGTVVTKIFDLMQAFLKKQKIV